MIGYFTVTVDQIDSLRQRVDELKQPLKYKRTFGSQDRIQFHNILNGVINLLARQVFISTEQQFPVLVSLNSLEKKIRKISQRIYTIVRRPIYQKTMDDSVIPIIRTVQKALEKDLNRRIRFPVNYDNFLDEFDKTLTSDLSASEGPIELLEKDTFHLLLDKEKNRELKGVDVFALEGSQPFITLKSFAQILSNHLIPSENRTENKMKLLKIVQQALKIAIKIRSLENCSSKDQVVNKYLKNLSAFLTISSKCENIRAHLKQTGQEVSESKIQALLTPKDRTYVQALKNRFSCLKNVPVQAVLNDIVWDILYSIQLLQPGDYTFFLAGTYHHCVAIEIQRIISPFLGSRRQYIYKVYNTGRMRDCYHNVQRFSDTTLISPMVIERLALDSFTYDFFEELIQHMVCYYPEDLNLAMKQITFFYELHEKHLIQKGGGRFLKTDECFPTQQKATCCYQCTEVLIYSHLDPFSIKQIEVEKAKKSVRQQHQIMIRQQDRGIKRSARLAGLTSLSPNKRNCLQPVVVDDISTTTG